MGAVKELKIEAVEAQRAQERPHHPGGTCAPRAVSSVDSEMRRTWVGAIQLFHGFKVVSSERPGQRLASRTSSSVFNRPSEDRYDQVSRCHREDFVTLPREFIQSPSRAPRRAGPFRIRC